jgi:YVTN family beta-propeller protein
LEVGLDPAGGSSYTSVGTQQLLSVPYALHAGSVDMADDGDWVQSGDTLHSDGKLVGIGTTAPTHPLTMKGNGQGFSQNSANDSVRVGTYASDVNGAYIQTHSAHPLHFATKNLFAQMTLDTTGRLGIGTTSPSAELDVAGTFKLTDGTQADKKILTSDADGNATWQDLSPEALFGSGNVPSGPPACPTLVANIAAGSCPTAIAFSGNYAYVVNRSSNNMMVFDITAPANGDLPIATIITGSNPSSIAISGSYAYVVNEGSNNMTVFDISTPSAPSLIATIDTGSNPSSIAVSGNYACVVNESSANMMVFDITAPADGDTPVATVTTGVGPLSVAISGNYAYVINSFSSSMMVFDIAAPSNGDPAIATIDTEALPISVAISGNYAYVVNFFSNTMMVFDISTPSAPSLSATIATGSAPVSVAVSGNHAFVVNNTSDNMMVFDISAPSNGDLPIATIATGNDPMAVGVSGGRAFVPVCIGDRLKVIQLACAEVMSFTPGGGFTTAPITESQISDLDHFTTADETDPQVGSNSTGYVPKWNGSSLSQGSLFDNGNVGIGTNVPQALLDIRNTTSSELRLGLSNSHWAKFQFSDSEGLRIESKHEGVAFRPALLIGSELKFYSGTGTTPERMRITAAGDVGIRTNNPGAELEVNGYTKLGSDAPAVKQKVVLGTFPAANNTSNITHGLNAANILSVEMIMSLAGSFYTEKSIPGSFYITSTQIRVTAEAGASTVTTGAGLKFLITYME